VYYGVKNAGMFRLLDVLQEVYCNFQAHKSADKE
jgi:hypothetical protein